MLGMLAIAIGAYVRPQMALASRLGNRAKMYYLAKSGVERAIAEINADETDSYDALNESWSVNDEAFGESVLGEGSFCVYNKMVDPADPADARYGLSDEESRININKASYEALQLLFEKIGQAEKHASEVIASSVIDWRDKDALMGPFGAENGYYETLDRPYRCKDGDFEIPEELLLVRGMTKEIYDGVKDRITLYGSGRVNINTADAAILVCIGAGDGLANKIVLFRNGNDGAPATSDDNIFESTGSMVESLEAAGNLSENESDELLALSSSGLLCAHSENFRGHSFGRLGTKNEYAKITFVFDRDRVIKYWKEE